MSKDLDALLLHDKTRAAVQKFLSGPSHALLISGPDGSGKLSLSKVISAGLLGLSADKLETYPFFTHLAVPEDKQEISIGTVRQVIADLRLKATGKKPIERVVLIENADKLSHEAQNAILKMLEEPASSTVFILSVPSQRSVLPTIASRAQQIKLLAATLEQTLDFYAKQYPQAEIQSAWQLSQGRPGLLDALLAENTKHPLKNAVDEAKTFIGLTKYERLIFFNNRTSKENLLVFLQALAKVLAALHRAAITKGETSKASRLLSGRKEVERAVNSLGKNGSMRLVTIRLTLNLKV